MIFIMFLPRIEKFKTMDVEIGLQPPPLFEPSLSLTNIESFLSQTIIERPKRQYYIDTL